MTEQIPPGLAKMNEVYGWDSPDYPGEFFQITRDHLFGEIWTRPGFDIGQRRLMLIGLMVGRGLNDVLQIQLDAAYRLGELDEQQLREIVIFMAHYAGWPSAAALTGIVEKIIAKGRA
ncbi:MAG TPA: carboxymuconolactone decarboxylase family protein [Jatrophihabitantaceae bacterium]|jgi:4-carboxymuconolactone decarboxylase